MYYLLNQDQFSVSLTPLAEPYVAVENNHESVPIYPIDVSIT